MDADAVGESNKNDKADANGVESTDEITATPTPEYLQQKLYFLLEHLKKMHCALPE